MCNATGTGLKPRSVLSVFNPGTTPSGIVPWATLKSQMDALDARGTHTPSPHICTPTWTQLTYSLPCAQIGTLAPADVYEQARVGIDSLMRLLPPSAGDGPGRQAYYEAVMGYAAVMSSASNVLGSNMATEYGPQPPPGQLHRDPPYYYGPQDAAFWRLDSAGSTRTPEATFNTTTDGVHHVAYISSGLAYVTRARALATALAPVTFLRYQAKKLTEYATYVAAWPPEFGTSGAEVIAKAGSAKSLVSGDFTTGAAITAAALNALPVVGQIASGVLAALTTLLNFLPAGVGATRCPSPFSYRVLTDSNCQPPVPPPPPPADFPRPGAPGGDAKSSIPTAALVVGGAVVLGALLFWPKK